MFNNYFAEGKVNIGDYRSFHFYQQFLLAERPTDKGLSMSSEDYSIFIANN
jgi:hypothetical protein